MAATGASHSLFISRATDTPPQQRHQHHLSVPSILLRRGILLPPCTCLSSGGGGEGSGGVSSSSGDTNNVSSSSSFSVLSSSRKRVNMLAEGFSAMADVLMGIEPLDESVIAEGVSMLAKDSMNRTVNRLLGVLPFSVGEADRFSFSIRASFHPLYRLLLSSIVTGYTLRRAEYRMSLTRILDSTETAGVHEEATTSASRPWERSDETRGKSGFPDSLEISPPHAAENLSPEALDYVQRLQLELASTKEVLDAHKQEMERIENGRGRRNDLDEYVQSLGPVMVTKMARRSSQEVKDMIHKVIVNTLRRISNNDTTSNFVGNTVVARRESKHDGTDVACDTIATSRDYLAKLLLWCMLLGHHLRGLEDKLHQHCVLGRP